MCVGGGGGLHACRGGGRGTGGEGTATACLVCFVSIGEMLMSVSYIAHASAIDGRG